MTHAPVPAVFDRRPSSPLVSFLVPVYNEMDNVEAVLRRLEQLPFEKEIIVVDDGSTDGTRDKLRAWTGSHTGLWFHAENQGKGGAIQTALAQARGRYAAIQDADLEYTPEEYGKLLEVLQGNGARFALGSRFLKENPVVYRRYVWGNKVLTWFTNFMCRSRFTDTYTCYKMMHLETFRSLDLSSTGFEMEAEICVKAACRNIPYAEVPIDYRPRRLDEGKKIGWRDAVKGLWSVVKFKQAEKNRPAAAP